MKNKMKDYFQFETKIGLNSGSFRTSIPKEIAEFFEIKKDDRIKWRININDNSINLSFKNTAVNIDEVTEKTTKKETTEISSTDAENIKATETTSTITTDETNKTTETSTVISDLNIEKNPLEYFEKMKANHETTALDKNNKIKISMQKNERKTGINFKLNFRIESTKENITSITIGSLKETAEVLSELDDAETEVVKEYIISKAKDKELVTEKLNKIS